MMGESTFEITGSTKFQRITLSSRLEIKAFEKLDANTVNLTVEEFDADALVEWAEEFGLGCRLV